MDGREVGEYQLSQVLAIRIQDVERSFPTAIPYKSLHDHHNNTLGILHRILTAPWHPVGLALFVALLRN